MAVVLLMGWAALWIPPFGSDFEFVQRYSSHYEH